MNRSAYFKALRASRIADGACVECGRFDVQRFGFSLDAMRTDEWNEVLLSGMRSLLAESGWHPPGRDQETFVTESRTRYWNDLNDLAKRALLDKGGSGGATQKGAQQLTFRR